MESSLGLILASLVEAGGSDLHLTAGAPPTVRVDGHLRRLPDANRLTGVDTEAFARSLVGADQWHRFDHDGDLGFACDLPGVSRFRVNLHRQRGRCGLAFRVVPHRIPRLGELDLPEVVGHLATLRRGLVLVAGPAGSGRTTTLAALVDLLNRTREGHILTIEDPIEFLHEHQRCLVTQREVGGDAASFAAALRQASRQDVDVILVGELRDLETTAAAVAAAEGGHLVLASLNAPSAAQAVDQIIGGYPPPDRELARTRLATVIQGIVAQALCPRADGQGRSVATEIMFATHGIRNLIRDGKSQQIPSFMQSGGAEGMLTFDQHLADRVREGVVTVDQARVMCHAVDDFTRILASR